MVVRKTRRGTRKIVAKKPAAKKAAAKTVLSANAQKRNRVVKKIPVKKNVTRKRPNTAVSKNLPKSAAVKKIVNAKVTPAKKLPKKIRKGKIGAILAGLTVLGGLGSIRKKPKSFGEAFKKARKDKGPNSTFTHKGKKYSTVTKDQIKKAGFTNLRDYLNSKNKK